MTTLKAGSVVTCANGHYVCTVVKDLDRDTIGWGGHFGNFEHGRPDGEPWGKWNVCKQCGEPWVRPNRILLWETHVNGEWV